MDGNAYRGYREACDRFSSLVDDARAAAPWLRDLQDRLRGELGYDDYEVENPVVYNLDLDSVRPEDKPPFILVADNPGKNEQKTANLRYLVGQSGKLAASWFARELSLDFRASTLIINKTPIHTPKTAELRRLRTLAGEPGAKRRLALDDLLERSQREMARIAFSMHAALGNTVWISGYGELGPRGVFSAWADEFRRLYAAPGAPRGLADKVWLFRHFSMNQFSIEYKAAAKADGLATGDRRTAMARLSRIGEANRRRVLGF